MKIPKSLLYTLLVLTGFLAYLYLDYINIMLYFDDAYTMSMVQRSFADIYDITSRDVHPPLYYWGLKLYSSLLGDTIFVERSFSTLGVLAVLLFASFALRKRFGDRVSLFFIILIILFPVTQFLAIEIRMYSWAFFFVLASAVFAYDVYNEGRWLDWTKFLFVALCAAYTHYYALMTIAWIFAILFIFLLKTKRLNKTFFISAFIFALFYSPWIYHLIGQIAKVKRVFWVHPITFDDIAYHLYYFYSIKKEWLPVGDTFKTVLVLGAGLIILIQVVLMLKVFASSIKKKDRNGILSVLTFVVFVLPIISGFVISFIFKPVIVPRYTTCSAALLMLSLAFVLDKCFTSRFFKGLSISFLILLGVYSGIRYYASVTYFKHERWAYNKMDLFIAKDKHDTHVFLSEYYETAALSRLSIFYPDEKYYVLMSDNWSDNFEPFKLNKAVHNQKFDSEFILVQKPHNEGGDLASRFRVALEQNYVTTDSIKALDMVLYKMKAKIITVPEDSLQNIE